MSATAELHPVVRSRVEIRCAECGYGGVVSRLPARCPMCGGSHWTPRERPRRQLPDGRGRRA